MYTVNELKEWGIANVDLFRMSGVPADDIAWITEKWLGDLVQQDRTNWLTALDAYEGISLARNLPELTNV